MTLARQAWAYVLSRFSKIAFGHHRLRYLIKMPRGTEPLHNRISYNVRVACVTYKFSCRLHTDDFEDLASATQGQSHAHLMHPEFQSQCLGRSASSPSNREYHYVKSRKKQEKVEGLLRGVERK